MASIKIRKEKLEGIIEKIITIKEQKFVTCIIENNIVKIIYSNNQEKEIKLSKYTTEIIKELKNNSDKNISISKIEYNNDWVILSLH